MNKRKAPPPHSFTRKVLHWQCCCRCGLILLKNLATEQAARKPCPD